VQVVQVGGGKRGEKKKKEGRGKREIAQGGVQRPHYLSSPNGGKSRYQGKKRSMASFELSS